MPFRIISSIAAVFAISEMYHKLVEVGSICVVNLIICAYIIGLPQ